MFDYPSVLKLICQRVTDALDRQILEPQHPAYGAFVNEIHAGGFPTADHVGSMSDLTKACQVFLAPGSPMEEDGALLERIRLAIAFQRRRQRPSGLIDLVAINYESPPDTGFTVELASPVVAVARRKTASDGARLIARELGEYVRTAASGMIGRGFHTPNHRWVVCSALSRALTLFPELPARAYIEKILAEGIDINADGEYSERSTGVYNAVSNRAFRAIADALDKPQLLDHVRANLDLMSQLLNADGSVVTSISTRQDQGLRVVPVSSIDSFYDMARRDRNGTWAQVADTLFDSRLPEPKTPHFVDWLLEPFLTNPGYVNDDLPRSPLPDNFARHFSASGVWRVKRGLLSATAAAGHRNLFSMQFGDVQLKGVKVSGTYLRTPNVRARQMIPIDNGVRLIHRGEDAGFPGYRLPVDHPVAFEDFYKVTPERGTWMVPQLNQTLDIVEVAGGFDLHLRSEGGLDRTTMELELSFEGPGEWETDQTVIHVNNDQTAILKSGHGVFRSGRHAIRVGPGDDAHRDWSMRESTPTPGVFRVLIPFVTPFDRVLEIRYGKWSRAAGFVGSLT